ncbi:DoxX family protein [Pseudodesulfovibrio indicus]|jgi:uncharacterized membrane protein YphA (DoxX/SURF4 family)|uniref:Methylamine utilization protein MauE n=1 Tax=Pseudodesulfovibrio indicus TaxID=1716143 RepID=A0A126QKH7_9BACT|nr:MauE/DoxX family redox-associated membrane protein [Pseudodesulfovibrio indicus]AMK10542.1 hypothetical protein AWY79_05120 [Pseudodesulfovibrio indicus]TDT89055.1 methylamine utilization protein MauE [Pseudodesulfovibrio indicus]
MTPLSSLLRSRRTYLFARVLLGGLFLVAGVIKFAAPEQLAVVIDAFGLVPPGLVRPMSYLLPAVEVVAGIGLIFDLRGSLSVVTFLVAVFLAVLAWGIHMGLDIDCGCYGPGDPEAEAFSGLRTAFGRDLLMLGGALYCFWWRRFAREGARSPSQSVVFKEN